MPVLENHFPNKWSKSTILLNRNAALYADDEKHLKSKQLCAFLFSRNIGVLNSVLGCQTYFQEYEVLGVKTWNV